MLAPPGQTIKALRESGGGGAENPFAIGGEWPALLRQLLIVDGLMTREVLREVVSMGSAVSRDQVALRMGNIVLRARAAMDVLPVSPPDRRKIKEFEKLILRTTDKRVGMSRGPGVLEHRMSPRLEWLVDLGYLNKDQGDRNRFTYQVTIAAGHLLENLDRAFGKANWPEMAAVEQWQSDDCPAPEQTSLIRLPFSKALPAAYAKLRPLLGPVSLRELAFVASLLVDTETGFEIMRAEIADWARGTEGVVLGRGRYARSDETIYIPDHLLR